MQSDIDWKKVDRLAHLVKIAISIQADWALAKEQAKLENIQLRIIINDYRKLRTRVTATLRHGLSLLDTDAHLPTYKKNQPTSDLIQDFYTIAYIYGRSSAHLAKLNMDFSDAQQALAYAKQLTDIVTTSSIKQEQNASVRQQRDKTLRLVYSLTNDICQTARFIFTDPQKRKLYCYPDRF